MDAVLPDTGGDQGRRRAQGGLPHREARQCGHRMVGEAAAGEQQRAGAGGPQDGCGDLCRDHGAEDIDVICGSEPFDGRVEDLTRIRQGSVVHGDARGAWGAEDPLERRTVAVQIFDVRAHRLDLKPVATQLRGELLQGFAAGDECAAKPLGRSAERRRQPRRVRPRSAGGDEGQQVRHMPPPGRARPAVGSGQASWGRIIRRTVNKVGVRRHHRITVISLPSGSEGTRATRGRTLRSPRAPQTVGEREAR